MRTCTRCGIVKDESGFSLKNGKPDARCKACKAELSAEWRKANPGKMEAKAAEWYLQNKSRRLEANAKWREANPERHQVASKRAMDKWRAANPDVLAANAGKYRAAKLKATPAWRDDAKIAEFYTAANFLGMVTGDWYHVDHIVPLNSKTVCGLHNEFNLQVLPGVENMRKGNRTWPGKP